LKSEGLAGSSRHDGKQITAGQHGLDKLALTGPEGRVSKILPQRS
jgi:hypothetical protein